MGTRAMKKDLFTLKALESKGFSFEKLQSLTDEEVAALPISTKLIEGIMELRARGGKTAEQIAEDIADLMMRSEDEEPAQPGIAQEYVVSDVLDQPMIRDLTEEQIAALAQPTELVIDDESEVMEEEEILERENIEDDEEVLEVDVVHAANKAEDIAVIKEALQSKSAKSFQPFIKHLKAEVPKDILEAVESTVVAELIEARIAEVKAESDK